MTRIDQAKATARAQRALQQTGSGASGPRRLTGSPTARQLALLTKLGVEERPDDRQMASRWIKTAITQARKADPTTQ